MSFFHLLLAGCLVTAPLMMIGGWGNSIFEPKLLIVLVTSFVLSGFLLVRSLQGKGSEIPLFAKGLLILAGLQAFGLWYTPNFGSGITALGLTVSWLIIFISVVRSDFTTRGVRAVALVLVSMCLFATVPDILFGFSWLSPYAPRGGMIGVKNALTVFLAQLIPLLLLALHLTREQASPQRLVKPVVSTLLILSLYVVLVSRTRSAWIMLMVYALGLALLHFKRRESASRDVLRDGFLSLACASALAAFLPTTLRWTDSSAPYLKSLSSLFSLEASSGRDSLWRVASTMIANAPWLGNGTGSYASQWPGFISQSGVAPGAFAFLRLDLPLFNDYLQAFVENGLLAGFLFVFLFLVVPVRLFFRQLSSSRTYSLESCVLTLMCVAVSVDALVDYPFRRVETSLFFVTALGIVCREMAALRPRRATIGVCVMYGVSGCVVVGLALTMTCAFWLRTNATPGDRLSGVVRSISIWPFDTYYSNGTVRSLISENQQGEAEKLVSARRRFWPSDPEGFIMLGVLQEERGDLVAAEAAYFRARHFVENGRCYWPGVSAYREFRARHAAVGPPYNASDDQAICQRRQTGQ